MEKLLSRRIRPYILLSVIFFSCIISASALDPGLYSVPLKNFHAIVYYENNSFYTIRVSGEVFKPLSTPFQRIIRKRIKENSTTVDIETGIKYRRIPIKKRYRYLRDTRFLNIKTAALRELAKKFTNKKNRISLIENFVHDFIQDKTTGIPLLPARNIIKSRSGDCTEHTILTVALLRANGIPARAVVGMILVPQFKGKKM